MKVRIFLGLVLLAGASGEAAAQCSGTQIVNQAQTTETAVVTFSPQPNGNGTITIAGLVVQVTGNRSAAEFALAFQNIPNGGIIQGSPTGFQVLSGTLTGWSTGAASGNTVTFTSAVGGNVANLNTLISVTAPTVAPASVVTTDGVSGAQNLTNLLSLSLVCGRPGPNYPGGSGSADRWQEQHRAGGLLFDHKLGPTHPRDPEKQVGTYSFAGTGTTSEVTHNYGGSATFAWRVFQNGSVYSFCTAAGAEHVRAFVTAGASASGSNCGGNYPP